MEEVIGLIGFELTVIPFIHLGILVGQSMAHVNAWMPLLERFHSKLSTWKANTLSVGDRLTLLKIFLGSLGSYWM